MTNTRIYELEQMILLQQMYGMCVPDRDFKYLWRSFKSGAKNNIRYKKYFSTRKWFPIIHVKCKKEWWQNE
jgi:hypothetical protein